MINRKFAQQLINQTVPNEASEILKRTFGANARQEIGFLWDLESQMWDYAREVGSHQLHLPERFYMEFDHRLRERLIETGNRVNLHGFEPQPLTDPSIHSDLGGRV